MSVRLRTLLAALGAAALAAASLSLAQPMGGAGPGGVPMDMHGTHQGMHEAMHGGGRWGAPGMPGVHGAMLGQAMPMTPGGADGHLAGLTGEEFEVTFMSMMVAHHEGAIEMAEWVLERTEDAEIRAAAEAVIAAQGPEIEQMTAWLQEWYGRELDEAAADMMRADMSAMMEQMAAGEDPDRAFLEMMSGHHMSAIDMAQLALVRAEHSELRALARDIVVAQAGEVFDYQERLAEDQP